MRKSPCGNDLVDLLRDRAYELQLDVARRLRRTARASRSPVTSRQRAAKCAATSATAGPVDAARRVVPAEPAAHRVLAGVVAIAAERGDVDTADERDLAVDDHELLVMAVHRTLMRVELAAHARSSRDLVAHPPHGRAVGREQRQRRAAPQQHSDVDPLRQLTEQIAQARRVLTRASGRSRQ